MKKYIQITAGRGPVECARTVTLVAREICKSVPGLTTYDCEPHKSEPNCYMSITLVSDQEIPSSALAAWEGTVLWHSTKNPYRPKHKRNNWFVGVHFIDSLDLPTINDRDIIYTSCRSRGKGGQHVNKVETAIRATHVPTGISVRCDNERSQSQNKQTAKERLMLKLLDIQEKAKTSVQTKNWANHNSLVRGNAVKRFSGPL